MDRYALGDQSDRITGEARNSAVRPLKLSILHHSITLVDALFVLRAVVGMHPFAGCVGDANAKCDDALTAGSMP
jgi:hypothetical protein